MSHQGPPALFQPLPAQRRQVMRQQLEAIVSTPEASRPHRTAIITGAAAFVVLGTGAGAGALAYLHPEPVTNKTDARCYTKDSLGDGINFPGTTIAEASTPGKQGQVTDALSVCAALWRQGIIGPGGGPEGRANTSVSHPVPRLVACRMPDGTAAIFPGNGRTCAKLGLPRVRS